jgi:hypothetical protein
MASEALAAAIRRLGVPVVVPATGVCASACFILFAASPSRYYIPGVRIGVHSATEGGHETLDSMGITTAMARSAAEMGVPDAIIGRMVRTPPGNVAWLSETELLAMGAVRIDITTPPVASSVPSDAPLAQVVPDATTAPSGPAALSREPVVPPASVSLHIIGGGSNGGCVAGAVALPARGDGYQTIHSSISHFYGAPVTIQGVITLGQTARENGLPPLLIGDVSMPKGGPMPGGRVAHQVGLDVDVGTTAELGVKRRWPLAGMCRWLDGISVRSLNRACHYKWRIEPEAADRRRVVTTASVEICSSGGSPGK